MTHRILMLTAGLLLLAVSLSAAPRELLIDLHSEPNAWYDTQLARKLQTTFSRDAELRVTVVTTEDNIEGRPGYAARTNTDSLMNWGMEMGGRYLLSLTITRETIERRKSFSLPLIFHKYETVGVIEGELRLLDLTKGRVLSAEPITVELVAKQQFQAEGDDNRHDPNLHIGAPQKSAFFGRLEDRCVEHLLQRVNKLIKGR